MKLIHWTASIVAILSCAIQTSEAETVVAPAFAFSLPAADLDEVVEIVSAALVPMRYFLKRQADPTNTSQLNAVFESEAPVQIALSGTPDCIEVTLTVHASPEADARENARVISGHFMLNLQTAARDRLQPLSTSEEGANCVRFKAARSDRGKHI
jgi:hypothetical protein